MSLGLIPKPQAFSLDSCNLKTGPKNLISCPLKANDIISPSNPKQGSESGFQPPVKQEFTRAADPHTAHPAAFSRPAASPHSYASPSRPRCDAEARCPAPGREAPQGSSGEEPGSPSVRTEGETESRSGRSADKTFCSYLPRGIRGFGLLPFLGVLPSLAWSSETGKPAAGRAAKRHPGAEHARATSENPAPSLGGAALRLGGAERPRPARPGVCADGGVMAEKAQKR